MPSRPSDPQVLGIETATFLIVSDDGQGLSVTNGYVEIKRIGFLPPARIQPVSY